MSMLQSNGMQSVLATHALLEQTMFTHTYTYAHISSVPHISVLHCISYRQQAQTQATKQDMAKMHSPKQSATAWHSSGGLLADWTQMCMFLISRVHVKILKANRHDSTCLKGRKLGSYRRDYANSFLAMPFCKAIFLQSHSECQVL
eukprot:scaffold143935_cov17-Tisochrysis_lutea.AAC.1